MGNCWQLTLKLPRYDRTVAASRLSRGRVMIVAWPRHDRFAAAKRWRVSGILVVSK